MLDVFFYEAFAEEAAELMRLLPAGIRAGYAAETIQESLHATPPARVISIRTQSQIPREWTPGLDAILARSTGYDHLVAYAAAIDRPPALGYLPLYCARAVAEHAMLLWMALVKRLPRQSRQFHDFHRGGLTGAECEGLTLAVVGVGNIGRETCRLGEALGMQVIGVDRDERHEGVRYVAIDEALAEADVIVCAMDLNDSNRGYFGADQWRRVKPGAVFVNVSRGELSPSSALLAALEAGQFSGVGLDVYDHEAELAVALRRGGETFAAGDAASIGGRPSQKTPDPVHPEVLAALALAQRDDCICTPHNAFNSRQAVERKSEHSVRQIVALREGGTFLWNVPLVTPRSAEGSG